LRKTIAFRFDDDFENIIIANLRPNIWENAFIENFDVAIEKSCAIIVEDFRKQLGKKVVLVKLFS